MALIEIPERSATPVLLRAYGEDEEWANALAFCDKHGEEGPDVLFANLEESRRLKNEGAVRHWTSMGRRLVEMHLAGARAAH